MKDKKFYITITPEDHSKVKQYVISVSFIKKILTGIFSFLILLSFGVFHYILMNNNVQEYKLALSKAQEKMRENERLHFEEEKLYENYAYLNMIVKNMESYAGDSLDEFNDSTGGIGGFSLNKSRMKGRALLKKLKDEAVKVENKISDIRDYYFEKSLMLSALPDILPVRGYISSGFGKRIDPITGKYEFHKGIDISAPYGAKIVAPADGVVTFAGAQSGYGYSVVISHKYGITTRYAHMSRLNVKRGQRVLKGGVIGFIGSTGHSTGPHLHFEIRINNKPINPLKFLASNISRY